MKKAVSSRIFALLMVVLVTALVTEARAQTDITPPPRYSAPVTLAWDPANDENVTGYAIYYGPTNQPATNRVYTGRNTTFTLFDLLADVGYKIYAVSCDANGIESVPSNALLLTPPAVSRLQVTPQPDGSMVLNCKAAPGTVCTTLFTPTLETVTWQALSTSTADSEGNVVTLDPTASQADRRFYRMALP